MLILYPYGISMHSTRSGETLWKKEIDDPYLTDIQYDMGEEKAALFVTKDIAGYFVNSFSSEVGGFKDWECSILNIYSATSGEFISSERINTYQVINREFFEARSNVICWTNYGDLHVFRVVGKEVKKYVFSVPVEHLIKTKQINPNEKPWAKWGGMHGFLGKTNVILGSFDIAHIFNNPWKHLLYGFNLDAAFAAKNENDINSAFFIGPPCSVLCEQGDELKPIYKTDRETGGIEIIGIMCEKKKSLSARHAFDIEKYFFVTEFNCSTGIDC